MTKTIVLVVIMIINNLKINTKSKKKYLQFSYILKSLILNIKILNIKITNIKY